jgi:cellulose synthase/poly-beta-1,6-N-acetylglucosamine synthase-like glycosyltransferase
MPTRTGWRRAYLPGRDLPVPESAARRQLIRLIAAVALTVTAGYLVWRVTSTVDPSVPWLSIPLVALEIHAALGLVLFTFSLWDVDYRPATHDVTQTEARLAVLIPTYNEGAEILLPTVAAAVAMRLEHETWVLDDGDRPEIARLAADLGARYLARPTHEHAKAGNLNHALGFVKADFVAVLDADHVASPDFLVRTLGYFDDPGVALVQTPQDFYNQTSFEHDPKGAGDDHYHEQVLFYRILQPGKNRWNGAFWCGTGAVVRLDALRSVGGVATDTITEDIHTTIRLHRRGWRTVYHNEVLARGLAAGDSDTYQGQRLRWGTGAMQVLRTENPLWVSGLTIGQRLSYAATLLGWFDAWRSLAFLVLPIAVIATGAVPIRANALTFTVAFVTTFALQQLALRVLSRGNHRPVLSTIFELVRMTSNLRATLTLVTRGRPRFTVTPKGRQGDGRRRAHVPAPLRVVLGASVVAAAWYALTLMGVTGVHYAVPWAVAAASGWMIVNAVLVFLAISRIRAARYAPERRASVRFDVDVTGSFGGAACQIVDLSLTGARILTGRAGWTDVPRRLEFVLAGHPLAVDGTARSERPARDGRMVVGVEFAEEVTGQRAELELALFRTRALPVAGSAGDLASDPEPLEWIAENGGTLVGDRGEQTIPIDRLPRPEAAA